MPSGVVLRRREEMPDSCKNQEFSSPSDLNSLSTTVTFYDTVWSSSKVRTGFHTEGGGSGIFPPQPQTSPILKNLKICIVAYSCPKTSSPPTKKSCMKDIEGVQ